MNIEHTNRQSYFSIITLLLFVTVSVVLIIFSTAVAGTNAEAPDPTTYIRIFGEGNIENDAIYAGTANATAESFDFDSYSSNIQIGSRQDAQDTVSRFAQDNGIDEDAYPEQIVNLLASHPESIEYVLGYPIYYGYAPTADIREDIEKADGGVPLFMQWDTRWGYKVYGNDCMGLTGCGPTCLSMVVVALTGDSQYTPSALADFAMNNGYYDYENGNGTYWSFMTDGAEQFGLEAEELLGGEEYLIEALNRGPVICSMGPGVFTSTGHFVVIAAYNADDNSYTINDPNSLTNSSRSWSYSEFADQINNSWGYTAL